MVGRVKVRVWLVVSVGTDNTNESGGYGAGFAEQSTGSTWTFQPTPAAGLNAVSCPQARLCIAVGSPAAQWNGTTWSAQTVPQPANATNPHPYLKSVSCPSHKTCTAVGYYYGSPYSNSYPLVERYS